MTRIAARKPLQTRVIFADEQQHDFLYFISSNISTSGIFVETKLQLKSGTRIFLKFSVYEGDPPIQVAAEVIRTHEKKRGPGRKKAINPGVGLKFLGLSRVDFVKIANFVNAI